MIYKSIINIMNSLGAIPKDKTLDAGARSYKYRGVDDVMNALQPILIENKVFVAPEVLDHQREERATTKGGNLIYSVIKMKYTFYAEDGSNVSAVVIGEGMDAGDKASNKAMSVAYKYACFQVFSIPTEEMLDTDATPSVATAPLNAFDSAKVRQVEELIKGTKYTMAGVLKSCVNNYKKGNVADLNGEEFADLVGKLKEVIENDRANRED